MEYQTESLSLAPRHAFVVQFHAHTDVEQGRMSGRVEHIVSGQATTFQSLENLLAFMARVLREVHKNTPEDYTQS